MMRLGLVQGLVLVGSKSWLGPAGGPSVKLQLVRRTIRHVCSTVAAKAAAVTSNSVRHSALTSVAPALSLRGTLLSRGSRPSRMALFHSAARRLQRDQGKGKTVFEVRFGSNRNSGGGQQNNNNNNNNPWDPRLFRYALLIAGSSFLLGTSVGMSMKGNDESNVRSSEGGYHPSSGSGDGRGGNSGTNARTRANHHQGNTTATISWQEFDARMLSTGAVKGLVVDKENNLIHVDLYPDAIIEGYNNYNLPRFRVPFVSIEAFDEKLKRAGDRLGVDLQSELDIVYKSDDSTFGSLVLSILGFGFLVASLAYMRGPGKGNALGGMSASARPPTMQPRRPSTTSRQSPSHQQKEGSEKKPPFFNQRDQPGSPPSPEKGKGLRGMDPFSMGKIKAYRVTPEKATTTFDDVAGLTEAKVELKEFVEFLKHPEHFQRLGAKVPKGAMLVGPPGTGKTLLAKAIAGESQLPFLAVSGSDFVEMFVGVGPSRVRDLFKQAREESPCVVYIDEIDAIAKARGTGHKFGGGSNTERESTLNQLLVEMDGFNTREGCLVLASTNRADILDKALMRPGRFDRMITCDLPTLVEREEIFKIHTKKLLLDKSVGLDALLSRLAALTPGLSGAQIAAVSNEAALIAARKAKSSIDQQDFEAAVERVVEGLEMKSRVVSQQEREMVACHEAGHAVVAWMLEHADPVLKISVIPRGSGSLGRTQSYAGNKYLHTDQELKHKMAVLMGGRAAEEVLLGIVTTGAADDLQRATDLAVDQATRFGMAGEKVGLLVHNLPRSPNDGKKKISNAHAQEIDEYVRDVSESAYALAKDIVANHKEEIRSIMAKLVENEIATHDELRALLGAPANNYDPEQHLLDEKEKHASVQTTTPR